MLYAKLRTRTSFHGCAAVGDTKRPTRVQSWRTVKFKEAKNALPSPASENPTTKGNQNPTKLKNAVAEKLKKRNPTTEKGSTAPAYWFYWSKNSVGLNWCAHWKRETWTSVPGHHMCAGSTTYLRISPAHPYPSTLNQAAIEARARNVSRLAS